MIRIINECAGLAPNEEMVESEVDFFIRELDLGKLIMITS